METKSNALYQGFNGNTTIWYSFDGAQFRNERDAHEVVNLNHTGWYTDADWNELAIGIIGSLPHGRFIAGYRLSDSGQRVYYPELFDNEKDAARMADEHARVIGEQESEYNAHWHEAQDLADSIEEQKRDVARRFALRHRDGFDSASDYREMEYAIKQLRKDKERLKDNYSDIEF